MTNRNKYLSKSEIKHLLKLALEGLQRAYVPYSGFKVGASALDGQGHYYRGSNIENASYSLTICAERNAVFSAVCEGSRDIKALAVVADSDEMISPCGACRQVISEFSRSSLIIMGNKHGDYKLKNIEELLPDAFAGKDLE